MRVLPIVINPVIDNIPLVDRFNALNPLYNTVLADLTETLGVQFDILPAEVDLEIPVKLDGFTYLSKEYLNMLSNPASHHEPDIMNYTKFMIKHNLIQRRNNDEFDEVHVWGGPFMGFHESQMIGENSYVCNSPPINAPCKKFVLMGLNYERGVSEALESFGHRTEFIFRENFPTIWDIYSRYVGTIHEPFNTRKAYDWGNHDMGLYGGKEEANCELWGCDGRGYIKWWFKQLPIPVKEATINVR
jgi:hypothetical protein